MDLRYPQIIDTSLHLDSRGGHFKFFGETPEAIALAFPYSIAEVFMTSSHKNVVRGLHFQKPPQGKVIQVVAGAVKGNILCCDPELPEFGQAITFMLEETSMKKIYVPGTWAPGYRALENDTKVLYLANAAFAPNGDVGIDPFDPALALDWGLFKEERQAAFTNELVITERPFSKNDAILSDRDKNLQSFKEFSDSLGVTE